MIIYRASNSQEFLGQIAVFILFEADNEKNLFIQNTSVKRKHDFTLKKPTTATVLLVEKSWNSSEVTSSFAGGPVFFFNQETMNSAVRPPVTQE